MNIPKRKYKNREHGTLRAEITAIIRDLPGVTSRQIAEFLPNSNRSSIVSALNSLTTDGVVVVSGKSEAPATSARGPRSFTLYHYSLASQNQGTDTVTEPIYRRPSKPTTAPVTDVTHDELRARIRTLEATVSELELWKKEAVARYPDLTVDPVVLKARRLVAEEVRASGDHTLADRILAGAKDDGLMVRVTIKALEAADV